MEKARPKGGVGGKKKNPVGKKTTRTESHDAQVTPDKEKMKVKVPIKVGPREGVRL